VPTFFIRSYGAAPGEVGIVYGLIVAVFGCGGIVFGGWLADRWLRRGLTDAALRVGLWAAIGSGITHVPLVGVGNLTWAYALLAPAVFFLGMPFGAAPAAIQEIVPNRMRGQTSAIYLFIVNLIGLGIGPTAVALITDYVFKDDNAVRWSILIVAVVASTAAAFTLAAGMKPYRETLKRLHAKG